MKRALRAIGLGLLGFTVGAAVTAIRAFGVVSGDARDPPQSVFVGNTMLVVSNTKAEAIYNGALGALVFVASGAVLSLALPLRRPPGSPEGGG